MKTILYLFVALVLVPMCNYAQHRGSHKTNLSNRQSLTRCATHEKMMEIRALDPDFDHKQMVQEQLLQNWIKNNYHQKASLKIVLTVPVVVQLWVNATTVSDARVLEQIDVLNKDYRRLNTDTINTPTSFKSIAADCEIEFCLATKDPQGNATSGIVRKTVGGTPTTSDLWAPSQYLNLLVYNLGGGTLGFTYLPSSNPNQGVHISYQYFGKTGASAPFNKGRTATHEVGHWFNLEHINGDANCGNDNVGDTPTQDQLHYGCFSAPYHTNICGAGTSPNGEMYMNYMDYTDDNCMNMFSSGQKTRMIAAINQYRPGLLNNGKCAPATPITDAGIQSIITPVGTLCSDSITPQVVLKNFGNVTITSCNINYKTDTNPASAFSWTGTLAAFATTNVLLPSLPTYNGNHTFTAFTSNPNGTTDSTAANDTLSGTFTINTIGQSLPFAEGFENPNFVPAGWELNNPDGAATWERTTVAAQAGLASVYVNNLNYNSNGQKDEIRTPGLNLSSVSNPALTFYVAYRLYTSPTASPNWSDTLEVLISTDCGVNYSSVYKKFSTQLTTLTPAFDTAEFVPDSSNWRMETVSLANYSSATNAMLKFRNITDFENNLYLDNINIAGLTSAGESALVPAITLYPNPTTGKFLITVAGSNISSIEILNVLGYVPYKQKFSSQPDNYLVESDFKSGIYFVKITMGENVIVKKIILN